MPDFPHNILRFDTVTSTNDVLRQLAGEGVPSGTAVTADCQTAGRGRMGRRFQSPAGLGLYLSVLYRPAVSPEELPSMTARGAVAAAKALEKTIGIAPKIKWPNDLVMRGKKIGGILTESALNADGTVAHVIMGIGINLCHTAADFTDEVRDMAASLEMLGCSVVRQDLENELLCQLRNLPDGEDCLEYYRNHCLTVGQDVKIMSTGKTARAIAVDENYGLVVRREDGGTEVLRCGEVSVRGLYGYVR